MNIWDVLLTVVVVAALALAVFLCVRKKTRGTGCCGSGVNCAKCRGRCERKVTAAGRIPSSIRR